MVSYEPHHGPQWQDAYAAWLFKLKPDNAADLDGLLDADAYQASL